jgi:parallel beta-helix repeat protein
MKTEISIKNRIVRRSVLLWWLILLVSLVFIQGSNSTAFAAGNTYYVSPNGNDSSDGSINNPWKTIQKCHNVATAGDKCLVASGEYTTSTTNITRPGITFECSGNCTTRKFTVSASNTTIRGFYITDTATSTDGYGISISSSGCIIENNHIYYTINGGIYLSAASSNCIVKNNKLERNSQLGIEVAGRNHLIEGNEIWGSIQYHPRWSNPPSWVDADGMRFFGSGHIFRSNYIHDINYGVPENVDPHIDCFQTWQDSGHEVASNILFEGNYCINQTAQAENEQGQGFMIEGEATNITIRNNILKTYRGVNLNSVSNISIYNNTFIGKLPRPQSFQENGIFNCATSTIVKNNIFYDIAGYSIYKCSTTLDAGYNLVYHSDGSSIWGSSDPNDLWGVNPLFVNPAADDYSLQQNSPAINAGYDLGSLNQNDYIGDSRPQGNGFDIGAYEFVTEAQPTATSSTPTYTNTPVPTQSYTPTATRTTSPTQTNTPIASQTPSPTSSGSSTATTTASPTTSYSQTQTPLPTSSASITPTPEIIPELGWEAEDGMITFPFEIRNGYISQSITTGVSNGGEARYSFEITVPGEYIIQASVKAPTDGNNSFFVNVDGSPSDPYMIWDTTVTSDFLTQNISWRGNGIYNANEFSPKVFYLESGTHELVVKGREAGTQLDNISITLVNFVSPVDSNNYRVFVPVVLSQ